MLLQGMDTGGLLVHGMDSPSLLEVVLHGVIKLFSRIAAVVRLESKIT
jgi:hypothetical protein